MDPTSTRLFGKAEERVLDEWYWRDLRELLRINVEQQRSRRPSVFVKSQVYDAMMAIAADTDIVDGRVYVFFGRPNSGKTVAGRVLLEMAGRKFQVKRGLFVAKERGLSLVSAVAKIIGAPDTGDLEWITTLFEALRGRDIEGTSLDAIPNTVLVPFCSCGLFATQTAQVVSDIGNEAPRL